MSSGPILAQSQHEDGRWSTVDETMRTANIDEPDGRPRNLGGLLATAAGAKSSDHLVIAGGGVELLIDLMHRGFANAVCAYPGHPLVGEDPDVLLIPDAGSPGELANILAGLGRRLHAAGVAVIYDRRLPTRERLATLDRLLAAYGFGALVPVKCAQGHVLKSLKLDTRALVAAA
ncbi:MAG: hypothetical protein JWO51_4545 [Rhodospirillales bacterium]|nr:hypothetical protein [Rhodospirillales bacterium]